LKLDSDGQEQRKSEKSKTLNVRETFLILGCSTLGSHATVMLKCFFVQIFSVTDADCLPTLLTYTPQIIDANGDGTITQIEFIKALRRDSALAVS
jgi:hypothetical protein